MCRNWTKEEKVGLLHKYKQQEGYAVAALKGLNGEAYMNSQFGYDDRTGRWIEPSPEAVSHDAMVALYKNLRDAIYASFNKAALEEVYLDIARLPAPTDVEMFANYIAPEPPTTTLMAPKKAKADPVAA